jgi:hypothetical protein
LEASRGIDRPSKSPGDTIRHRRSARSLWSICPAGDERLGDLVDAPGDVRALDAASVSVEGRREAIVDAKIRGHEVKGVQGDVTPLGVVREPSGRLKVHPGEQRLVAEHLFEVRHVPLIVDAVTREATSKVVVETTSRHCVQGTGHRVNGLLVVELEQRAHVARSGKLRRTTESAVLIVCSTSSSRRELRERSPDRANLSWGARWSTKEISRCIAC